MTEVFLLAGDHVSKTVTREDSCLSRGHMVEYGRQCQ